MTDHIIGSISRRNSFRVNTGDNAVAMSQFLFSSENDDCNKVISEKDDNNFLECKKTLAFGPDFEDDTNNSTEMNLDNSTEVITDDEKSSEIFPLINIRTTSLKNARRSLTLPPHLPEENACPDSQNLSSGFGEGSGSSSCSGVPETPPKGGISDMSTMTPSKRVQFNFIPTPSRILNNIYSETVKTPKSILKTPKKTPSKTPIKLDSSVKKSTLLKQSLDSLFSEISESEICMKNFPLKKMSYLLGDDDSLCRLENDANSSNNLKKNLSPMEMLIRAPILTPKSQKSLNFRKNSPMKSSTKQNALSPFHKITPSKRFHPNSPNLDSPTPSYKFVSPLSENKSFKGFSPFSFQGFSPSITPLEIDACFTPDCRMPNPETDKHCKD